MIVNYTAEGWEIITQRAHGLLAAQIADHWQHHIRTDRWVETFVLFNTICVTLFKTNNVQLF